MLAKNVQVLLQGENGVGRGDNLHAIFNSKIAFIKTVIFLYLHVMLINFTYNSLKSFLHNFKLGVTVTVQKRLSLNDWSAKTV